jgi:hypothetical protein
MTMTIPMIPDLQPIAGNRRPAAAQNAQFGVASPSTTGDRSATQSGGSRTTAAASGYDTE